MITMRRQLLGLGLVAASSLLALHAANALSGPTAIAIDGGPLGPLNLSGGVDGYGYFNSGTGDDSILGAPKSTGALVGSALVELQKTTGELQFTIEIGSNGGTTPLGGYPGQTSITTFTTGPLYAGYLTLAPASIPGLTVSAGQLGSLEGWESGVDWNNSNQLTTEIFDVQNSQSRGVEASYTFGPVAATVEFGDGYDNGVWNYLQFLLVDTINPTNEAAVYGGANLGTTGPYATSYAGDSPVYANSDLIGAFYSYTMGNLNLVPEIQYQHTKAIAKIGLSKPVSNFGAAVFADYSIPNSPYSLGAWAEYWTSHAAAVGDTPPNFSQYSYNNSFEAFVGGPNSQGIGISVSPTWQYKDLFARADLGGLYLITSSFQGESFAYGANGKSRAMFTGELEAGLLF